MGRNHNYTLLFQIYFISICTLKQRSNVILLPFPSLKPVIIGMRDQSGKHTHLTFSKKWGWDEMQFHDQQVCSGAILPPSVLREHLYKSLSCVWLLLRFNSV